MKLMSQCTGKAILLSFSLLIIASCGDSSNDSSELPTPSPTPPPVVQSQDILCENLWNSSGKIQVTQQNHLAIIKSIPNPVGGVYLLMESLPDKFSAPGQRLLQRLDCQWTVAMEYPVAIDENIVDFELHENGELTLLVVSSTEFTLHRIDLNGDLLNKTIIENIIPLGAFADIAFSDDTLFLAARHDDLSVSLSSFNYTQSTGFTQDWRTMVEPETSPSPWGMIGGSYDTFEQLVQNYQVFITLDQHNNAYVTVPGLFALFHHHNEFFDEQLLYIGTKSDSWEDAPKYWPQMDALVTKITISGERIYTRVIGTDLPDEIYGSKIIDNLLYVFGRSTRFHGQFWDGFIATMNIDSGNLHYAHNVDINEGDIFYDVTQLSDGRILAVGATAWHQNPVGYSVSENSEKLAAFINIDGIVTSTITLPHGSRHNQIRSVTALNDQWLLFGGFDNGPGTHSGDSDSALIRADAFLTTYKLP